MEDDSEIYGRLTGMEITQARHDERLKTLEDFAREVRQTVIGMQIKLAGIVAVVSLIVQLGFKFWK